MVSRIFYIACGRLSIINVVIKIKMISQNCYPSCRIKAQSGGDGMAIYDFGIRLKELREGKRLSQSDVADRLEVTRATISGYECNTITPSVEQLVKLAVLYNTSLDYMLGMENRSYLYLDDLSESQQKTILDVVDRLKKEFLNPL